MRLNRRCAAKLLVAPALMAGLRTFASTGAESYPAQPVRIIVPYPAGGPYDGIPRLIAQWIGARHGWSIVIDNRSGAGRASKPGNGGGMERELAELQRVSGPRNPEPRADTG